MYYMTHNCCVTPLVKWAEFRSLCRVVVPLLSAPSLSLPRPLRLQLPPPLLQRLAGSPSPSPPLLFSSAYPPTASQGVRARKDRPAARRSITVAPSSLLSLRLAYSATVEAWPTINLSKGLQATRIVLQTLPTLSALPLQPWAAVVVDSIRRAIPTKVQTLTSTSPISTRRKMNSVRVSSYNSRPFHHPRTPPRARARLRLPSTRRLLASGLSGASGRGEGCSRVGRIVEVYG